MEEQDILEEFRNLNQPYKTAEDLNKYVSWEDFQFNKLRTKDQKRYDHAKELQQKLSDLKTQISDLEEKYMRLVYEHRNNMFPLNDSYKKLLRDYEDYIYPDCKNCGGPSYTDYCDDPDCD